MKTLKTKARLLRSGIQSLICLAICITRLNAELKLSTSAISTKVDVSAKIWRWYGIKTQTPQTIPISQTVSVRVLDGFG